MKALPRHIAARMHAQDMSDEQWSYIRILLREAFVHHYDKRLYVNEHHRPERMNRTEASALISTLKAAKEKGWKA